MRPEHVQKLLNFFMSETKHITVTHGGVVIVYDENQNKWQFELRNRGRAADSLALAKAIIDKPFKDKNASQFQPFEAWHFNRFSGTEATPKVKVNSIAVPTTYDGGRVYYWISNNGTRSKASGDTLFPCNAHNDPLVAAISANREQRRVLQKELSALAEKLTTAKNSSCELGE